MKAAGMGSVNPSSPRLTAAIESGITTAEFAQAAADAVALGKGFSYAIAMAIGRRSDAAKLAQNLPGGGETFAERDARIGRERWEQQTGRVHPDNMPARTVIDITPQRMELTA